MGKLCDTWNKDGSSLPAGFTARYEMTSETVLVAQHNGSGGTLDVHHRLIFSNGSSNDGNSNSNGNSGGGVEVIQR
jgi:hypothetical protein